MASVLSSEICLLNVTSLQLCCHQKLLLLVFGELGVDDVHSKEQHFQ